MKNKGKVPKTDLIVIKEALDNFEMIGKIIEEGIKRGFKRKEIIQLIARKVIKL